MPGPCPLERLMQLSSQAGPVQVEPSPRVTPAPEVPPPTVVEPAPRRDSLRSRDRESGR